MGKYDFDCEPLPKLVNTEFFLTKKEYEALIALRNEHRDKEIFTAYYKDENEISKSICSNFMMQRLEKKLIIEKINHKKKAFEPQKYKWGIYADC